MKSIRLEPIPAGTVASVSIPGSKSVTNRALILAALSHGQTVIHNLLESDDTTAMIQCLRAIGFNIRETKNEVIVSGSFERLPNTSRELNCGLSGTTMRFLLALAPVLPGTTVLFGEEGLNKRPVLDLVHSLQENGADITFLGENGFPPVQIQQSQLKSREILINGSISSQFTSALLMAAPLLGIEKITRVGDIVSESYINLTIQIMENFGVQAENEGKTITVPAGQHYEKDQINIEGDWSSACYFAAIAALTKSTITLKNLRKDSLQGDREFLSLLQQMGNTVVWTGDGVTIKGQTIKPLTVDMTNCPDQIQTLAVLNAFTVGKTTIHGIRSLRVKETNRVDALVTELKKMGIAVDVSENTMIIHGGQPKSAAIDTYGDHRMAMAFSVAGAKLEGMEINNPEVVSKTFPDYWEKCAQIGGGCKICKEI